MNDSLYNYLLMIGDNAMILGHRLSELCGHGPNLETDIALTNISLDLFGQTRYYFQYAAELAGDGASEDSVAFLRYPHQYKNVLLVEQPNTDFAFTIVRQFFFDAFHKPFLEQLSDSADKHLAAIAAKSLKEVQYHLSFSSEWVRRLGGGTEESHRRTQRAVEELYPYTGELLRPVPLETEMQQLGIGPDLEQVAVAFEETVTGLMSETALQTEGLSRHQSGGKAGIHSEYLGFILADLQYMQRTYPGMEW